MASSVPSTSNFVSQLNAMRSQINVAITQASNSINHTENVDETLGSVPAEAPVNLNIGRLVHWI